MKRLALLISFIFLSVSLISLRAQPYDAEKVNKKAIPLFNEAMAKVEDGKGLDAVPLLKQALDKDSRYMDAWLLLAAIYSDHKKYDDCIAAYEKAFAIDPVYSFEYKLPYSIAFAGKGEFEKALESINSLLAAPKLN
ncbi:MAG TPA: tetratricopeptide repeat protein, partial [Chitinophagaceae bacterium]|nr:tetratricopeptide repeat protein [Chitinophagaceae bacterium]